jgi:chorismate mutase/prephenate dehydratase
MDIQDYRKEIDKIDNQIIELLNQRARSAQEIGRIKKEKNLPIYVPEREKAIYEKIRKINRGIMPTKVVNQIFRQIISYTRSLEYPLKVSFLGPEGSYTHQAALSHFGSSIEEVGCPTIHDIFLEVEKDKADYGVVPIENSYNGVVFQTLDALLDSELVIIGEIYMRIRHALLSRESKTESVQTIYGHPQSLEQCRIYLDTHLMKAKRIQVASNSEAALRASKEKNSAAIASEVAGEIYGLNALATGIEDVPDNTTRFIILGKEPVGPWDSNKTSIVCSISNRPGALADILMSFSSRNIDLSKIESRPSKRKAWDYIFFIDFNGHIEDKKVLDALNEIREKTLFVKILGSYPAGGSF